MPLFFVALMALGLALLVGGVWLGQLYSGLAAARHGCDRAHANLDVLLKERHDELPKLVEICRGYMAHERDAFEAVTLALARSEAAKSFGEQALASAELSRAVQRLLAVAEGYPELKAALSFQATFARVGEIEAQLVGRCESFNATALAWNARIEQRPDLWIANRMKAVPRELWKVGRQPPEVSEEPSRREARPL